MGIFAVLFFPSINFIFSNVGVVEAILSDNFFYRGNFVLIGHDNNFKSSYSHLSEILVKQNEIVRKGQLIGLMGKSGRVTGSHLHFEVLFFNKKLNPELFIQ